MFGVSASMYDLELDIVPPTDKRSREPLNIGTISASNHGRNDGSTFVLTRPIRRITLRVECLAQERVKIRS